MPRPKSKPSRPSEPARTADRSPAPAAAASSHSSSAETPAAPGPAVMVPPGNGVFRLAPAAVVGILCGVLLLAAAAWTMFRQRREISALRQETVSLTQAQRATASRESAAAAALGKLAETEAALAKARAELTASTAKSAARIEELDHLVTFLRGEATAAQQTIERMKTEAAAAQPPAAPAKPSQGKR